MTEPGGRARIEGALARRRAVAERQFGVAALVYVHLWILEGAFRKWIPGADTLFYVARDAFIVVALLLLLATAGGSLRPIRRLSTPLLLWILGLSAGGVIQVIAGLTTLPVALVGVRAYVAPVLLVYGCAVFRPPHLASAMARTIACYAVPMVVLVVVQVLSPPSSPINREVLSDAPRFINGDVVRALGTFSAPAGLAMFMPLALAVSLALLMTSRGGRASFWWLTCCVCSVAMIALGGSRLAVLGAIFVVAFFFAKFAVRVSARRMSRLTWIIALLTLALALSWERIAPVITSFSSRFDQAARAEDAGDRLLEQSFGFLSYPLSFVGDGLGSHTLAGINLGSPLPWVEWDTEKWVAEAGVLGLVMAIVRLTVASALVIGVWVSMERRSWITVMATSVAVPVMFYGQITQLPSNQAFFSVAASLIVLSWAQSDNEPYPPPVPQRLRANPRASRPGRAARTRYGGVT